MRSIVDKYSMTPGVGVVVYDPATLAVSSMAATAVGGAVQAAGTVAGGNAAAATGLMQQQAANYQAAEDTQNATQAFASGQRNMLEAQDKTRLAISSARAIAGGSGVNAGVGSPVSIVGELAKRGSYNAAMEMFNGQSTATGLLNKAAGERYSGQAAAIGGQEARSASELAAAGTVAGSAGSLLKTYGGWQYPQYFRSGN